MTKPLISTIRIVIIFLSGSLSIARADSNGGSAYSRYGLGDVRYVTAGRGIGMAGAGLGAFSSFSTDPMNPAGWGKFTRARFSATALYEGFSSDDGNDSRYLSRTNFNGFMLALPVSTDHGVVVSAGMTPYTRVNYDIITASTQAGLASTLRYIGEGGLSTGHVGASVKLGSDLFVGSKFLYYFGSVSHTVRQSFSTTDLSDAEVRRSSRSSGFGFTFGAIYTGLKNVLNLDETESLQIGAMLTTTSYLSTTNERIGTYTTGKTRTQDTTTGPEGKIRVPYSLATGIAFTTDRYVLAGDFYYQHWNDFTVDGAHPDEIRDSYRMAAGAELLAKRDPFAAFTQRMIYRFGLYYDASYYRIKGEPIHEWGFTAGIGMPIFQETRLTIGAEYGFRGTTAAQLQRDHILRISFSLNISEPWFVRPEEE